MVNYSSWPNYKKITEEQRARLVGICQFVNIDPPGFSADDLDNLIEPGVVKKHSANALSAMRDRSADEADLRIAWGGRISGASGWMAGILEEIAYALKYEKPVLILGGFGGCARLLADFLSEPSAPWPDRLNLEECADADRDLILTDSERKTLNQRMTETQRLITKFRTALHGSDSVYGLASNLPRSVFLDDNSRTVINVTGTAANLRRTG